jgi:hypothetical protein
MDLPHPFAAYIILNISLLVNLFIPMPHPRAMPCATFTTPSGTGGRTMENRNFCPEYGEHYYAAFVIDPDGYRIEAVINEPN